MAVFMLSLVRHGQTEFNRESIIQGQLNVPLSAIGKQQATLLGHRLQNEVFTHIYSSDLIRASETARIILEQNHASNCAIIEDSLLRERKFGIMEGKPAKYLIEAANEANLQIKSFTPLNGETYNQVRERAIAFFQQLCKQFLIDTVQDDDFSSAYTQSSEKIQVECSHTQDYKIAVHAETWKNYNIACSHLISTSERNIPHTSAEYMVNKFIPDKIKTKNSSKFLCQQQLLDVLNNLNDSKCIDKDNIVPTTSKPSDESPTLANILMVSHGGLISEMICYLVEICGCELPGGPKQAFKIAPNCSFSKFIISVKKCSAPQVKCLHFHDKQHLNQSYDSGEGKNTEKSL